jgi:hypothetical protein
MKHTIEKVVGEDTYIFDDEIIIKWVEQLGNDNGWCIFDKDSYYQKVYQSFENVLLTAMGKSNKSKKVLTPPAGV